MNSETNKDTIEMLLEIAADIQRLQPEDRLTQIIQSVQDNPKDPYGELDDDDLKAAAGGIKGPYSDSFRKPPFSQKSHTKK